MVAHSGATVRADRLRPLNIPRPIRVKVDERGRPVAVEFRVSGFEFRVGTPNSEPETRNSKLRAVIDVLDRWRIDDEWWRQEISRMYFRVALAEGRTEDSGLTERTEDSGLRTEREVVPQSSALSPQSFVRPQSSYLVMIFHDLVGGGWYVQEAAQRGGQGSGIRGRGSDLLAPGPGPQPPTPNPQPPAGRSEWNVR